MFCSIGRCCCLPSWFFFILLLMAGSLLAEKPCGPSRICALQAEKAEQTLTQDNLPDFALRQEDTIWRIEANPGELVNLTLGRTSVVDFNGCGNNTFRLFDENNGMQSDLGLICQGQSRRTFISSYSAMSIKYVGSSRMIFKLYYRSVSNPNGDACTGVPLILKATTTVKHILSPNFPLRYPSNTNCAWRIVTEEEDKLVYMHVNYVHLARPQYPHAIPEDYVRVFDGATEYDYVLGALEGGFEAQSHISSSQAIYVRFHAGNHNMPAGGFNLSYQAVTQERVFHKELVATNKEKEVKNPLHHSSYQNHANVSWTIRTDSHSVINVSILHYQIEKSLYCINDYLDIYDGANEMAHHLQHLCGYIFQPLFVISSGPVVFIRFLSNKSIMAKGFKFKYSKVEPKHVEGCPQGFMHVTADENGKEIKSPGFPHSYPTNSLCEWKVTSDSDLVTVTFDTLDLKSRSYCVDDYLKIYDENPTDKNLLKRFCEYSHIPTFPVTSTSNVIFIRFRSGDRFSINAGFKLFVKSKAKEHEDPYIPPPSDGESSSSGHKGATFGAVAGTLGIIIVVVILVVVKVCAFSRAYQRLRTPRRVVIRRRVATLRVCGVIQTNSQQAGLYVTSPAPQTVSENNTAAGGNGELPPSYAEVISDSQHLILPPEYTPRASSNSYDNEACAEGRNTGDSDNPQEPKADMTTA